MAGGTFALYSLICRCSSSSIVVLQSGVMIATVAAIIASQAMISSASFSCVKQAMALGCFPRLAMATKTLEKKSITSLSSSWLIELDKFLRNESLDLALETKESQPEFDSNFLTPTDNSEVGADELKVPLMSDQRLEIGTTTSITAAAA
ncbi:hypothetical protein FXO38_33842 [Capsicum annuum]|uniref:K+ potassium transporter integral membrane domain-containing protein n=1 Tax=Capsicum annuum TaxID=4072 RepID=A0A2G2XX16_CAPAN|nr:hypothetical protein FXO38_33842 [Capsicum annuum]KAF3618075.1 hypothetical protein FXO37_34365 [Capsicum annuum]PHT62057.1 hypothetical protein T459_34078 [Capsicum annuum]